MNIKEKLNWFGAIDAACGNLPDGWVIHLCMENGAVWLELISPDGDDIMDKVEWSDDHTIPEQIALAVKYARGDQHG